MRTNPSTLAAGLGAVKNALRKLTDQTVKMAYPMYRVSQISTVFIIFRLFRMRGKNKESMAVESILIAQHSAQCSKYGEWIGW